MIQFGHACLSRFEPMTIWTLYSSWRGPTTVCVYPSSIHLSLLGLTITFGPWRHAYALLQAITAECHEKATSLVLESVTQGCSVWLQCEPEVLTMSVLLLAVGTTSSRQDLLGRVSLDGRARSSCMQFSKG